MANKKESTQEFSIQFHDDISEADIVTSANCPLCKSRLKLYQIHFDEKFLMCANVECVYPFGVSDAHIFQIECNEEFTKSDTRSDITSPTLGSFTSNSDWSEVDKLINADGPLSPNSTTIPLSHDMEIIESIKKKKEKEEIIRKNVEKIKELTTELYRQDSFIGDKKLIHEISQMQELSGVQLLKKPELEQLDRKKENEPELKVDIDSSKNAISFQIEVKAQKKTK